MATANATNLYINWVLHAVFGMTAEADAIARMDPGALVRIADLLRTRHPITARPLYRGLLLEHANMLHAGPDPRTGRELPWLSWSEDRDVARWFGHPGSYISEPFREFHPKARGFVLSLSEPDTERVLWHHSWRHAFGPPLERLALVHPFMGERGCQQIAWSLDTQCEVITVPLDTLPEPEPVDDVPGATIAELDARLTPSWIS